MGSVAGNSNHPTCSESRILEVLRSLRQHAESLTLATIDGEFYWRCCRQDFQHDIALILKEMARRGDPHWLNRRHLDNLSGKFGIPHEALLAHMIRDAPIAVREAAISLHEADPDGARRIVDRLSIEVPAPTWSGRDVAQRLEYWFAQFRKTRFFPFYPPRPAGFDVRVTVQAITEASEQDDDVFEFQLARPSDGTADDPPSGFWFVSYGHVAPPCLRVMVWHPWPPAQLIGAIYETAVREHPEWEAYFPTNQASAGRQSPEVALRTWAVGLLLHAGLRWREAMTTVCTDAHLAEIERPGFVKDRERLQGRVPQAAPYLYPPNMHRANSKLHGSAPTY